MHHFVSNNDQKAEEVVEHFDRKVRSRVLTYFTAHQRRHYLEILPKIVAS